MRQWFLAALVVVCLLILCAVGFGPVLLRDRQFASGDSAFYYYPLYQRVHAEWRAGRWPLWEPAENGGMPLLGNPTAAVFYPGQLLYAVLPYAWGARLYVIAHVALAFGAMLALARSWGMSATGSALAALSYAFGAPVLFQYSNIIYLVGAAWLPLGFREADRWLRLGRVRALLGLAVVLAMQTLGGDPESAYLTLVCAGGYALGLGWVKDHPSERRWSLRSVVVLAVVSVVAWIGVALLLAAWLPGLRPRGAPVRALPWSAWFPWITLGVWAALGVILLRRPKPSTGRGVGAGLLGLVGAGLLAGALAAVQVAPALEFVGQSSRTAEGGAHDIYQFSLEPAQVFELAWPHVFQVGLRDDPFALAAIPRLSTGSEFWVPSLYVGGLTIISALGALGFRDGPAWRGWLTAIAVISLLAAFGRYASPLPWARWARWEPSLAAKIGPHDPPMGSGLRPDGYFRDGDGGVYWALATALPGFAQFRYPAKLLNLTALAASALAGLGWEHVIAGRGRRVAWIAGALLALSLPAAGLTAFHRDQIVGVIRSHHAGVFDTPFGPTAAEGAFRALLGARLQASAIGAVGLALVVWGRRRPGLAGTVALTVMGADLAWANARHIQTAPQAVFDAVPRAVRLIDEAERTDPGDGPFRIHRLPVWAPAALQASHHPVGTHIAWSRDTLQPKYGEPYGLQYTQTIGVAELYDYEWFFGGFFRTLDPTGAALLQTAPGRQVVVYPRRGFDLWNTRYFLMPGHPNGWNDPNRGFASFLARSERIYPPSGAFDGPGGAERLQDWLRNEDFQILRNRDAFPRAWVVHQARVLPPLSRAGRAEREAALREILFANDPIWSDPSLPVYDPHTLAWIEDDQSQPLREYLPGGSASRGERVRVTRYEPQRVEIDVDLERPGLVVLADVDYPGWRLTIDGVPARIYRTNWLMRGAAVRAGRHHLEFTFHPRSFSIGVAISCAGLGTLVVAFLRWKRSSPEPRSFFIESQKSHARAR